MAAAALYTPAVLGLATGLAALPIDEGLPWRGSARSQSCGSTLTIGVAVDDAGRITRVGVSASACAIGQAAAALFAAGAIGRDLGEVTAARGAIEAWLAGGAQPVWPGLADIAPAVAFPGRHGAILLAWRAAEAALAGRAIKA